MFWSDSYNDKDNYILFFLQVEQRLNDIRDNMSQWDSVDRMRGELRAWLRDKQEEVEDIEQQPSKLHAEAAELDIAKLQVLRMFKGF